VTLNAEETPLAEPTPQPAPRRPAVLVVDDNPAVRQLLAAWLEGEGFAVWLAEGGPEAVEVYRRRAGAIDLALLDVNMPAWDGPRTLAALREIDPHLRCCFVSGHTGPYAEADLLALGAPLLRKPFSLAEAAGVLRQLLGGP
jgi:two-component system, OmpR family, response regulator